MTLPSTTLVILKVTTRRHNLVITEQLDWWVSKEKKENAFSYFSLSDQIMNEKLLFAFLF